MISLWPARKNRSTTTYMANVQRFYAAFKPIHQT